MCQYPSCVQIEEHKNSARTKNLCAEILDMFQLVTIYVDLESRGATHTGVKTIELGKNWILEEIIVWKKDFVPREGALQKAFQCVLNMLKYGKRL